MQAKGFNVLSIDGRGFGESTKKADGSMVSAGRSDADVKAMLGDVNAAIEYLSSQKNVDQNRIGIVGASYGSSLAIIYAADNAKIRSVALLSPGLNYFGNMPTEPAVKKYGNRDLFLAASTEDRESADAVTQLGAAAGPPGPALRSSTVVTTGGHGTGLFKADGRVKNELEQFLIKSLKE
jgi:dienelactone hydrolase